MVTMFSSVIAMVAIVSSSFSFISTIEGIVSWEYSIIGSSSIVSAKGFSFGEGIVDVSSSQMSVSGLFSVTSSTSATSSVFTNNSLSVFVCKESSFSDSVSLEGSSTLMGSTMVVSAISVGSTSCFSIVSSLGKIKIKLFLSFQNI